MRWQLLGILALILPGVCGCTTDVSGDPTLRGGYARGQTLRLRADGYTYRFDKVHHPAEAGTHVVAPRGSDLRDAAARAEWERSRGSTIIATLPAGTMFRVERIDYLPTLDTATIVPRGVILSGGGAAEERRVSLNGISVHVPSTNYPYPLAPDPTLVEVIAPK
jgi:hypothetical protein